MTNKNLDKVYEDAIAEIEKNVSEFKAKLDAGTADPEKFITLSEIESLWASLNKSTTEFAKDIFKNDESKYRPWAEKICTCLENGEWKDVLKSLEKYKDRPSRPGCVNLYTYINNNADNINYPAYKQQGFFVVSGAIESANKVVLQNRLKLPGMRWNVKTAQYVLSLKAKLESGLWDSEVVPLVMNSLMGKS